MAYATLTELQGRLDWELDEDERRIAVGALEDASDLAASYGRAWPEATAPRLVKTLVLKAASRYVRNPNGYTQSRAGDETLAWSEAHGRDAGSVYFTREEIRLLTEFGGRKPTFSSAPVTAWESTLRPDRGGLVPAGYPGDPFPMFSSDRGPW
ncbi:hypothetical protein ACQEVX_23045 [Streptomyces syringium]|uniref:hypothetical protein n=1 Tax=Streptomyces syringium TaxID=76729 RepID=UPI003D8EEE5E